MTPAGNRAPARQGKGVPGGGEGGQRKMMEWALEGVRRILRWEAGLRRHEVQVDDHRWAYLDGGEGEAILFVHGYGMEKDGWDIFARAWSHAYRLVIPDLPGFGETSRIDSSVYDVPHQVERLDRFVNALGIPSFHLVGISMGGAIAAYYAGEHPSKVKSLFLMAPAGVLSRLPSAAWREYREKGKIVLLYEKTEEFDRLLDAVFYRKPFVPRAFKRYFAHKGALNYRFREKILRDLEKGGIDVLEDRLAKVEALTLVIWGKDDRILHVSGAEKFQRALPRCHTVILGECGHVVFFDRPRATRRAYRDFLQGVEPHGQEPVAPMLRRNPPKLQSSFAKASEDTRIPPRSGDRGFLQRRVKANRARTTGKAGYEKGSRV